MLNSRYLKVIPFRFSAVQRTVALASVVAILEGICAAQCSPSDPTDPTDPPYDGTSDPCTSTRLIEGLINGDFERVVLGGTLGSSLPLPTGAPTTPVDGTFWVGAEGMTAVEGGNRFLRIEAASSTSNVPMQRFAYQRIPAVDDGVGQNNVPLASGIEMEVARRLANPHDEAWISLTEADREHYTFGSFLGFTDNSIHYKGYPGRPTPLPDGECHLDPTTLVRPQLTPARPDALWSAYWTTATAAGASSAPFPMGWYFPYQGKECCDPSPVTCWQPVIPNGGCSPVGKANSQSVTRSVVEFYSPNVTCPLPLEGLPGGLDRLSQNLASCQVSLAPFTPTMEVSSRSISVVFTAPRAGCVRVGSRYWSPILAAGPSFADVLVEVLHVSQASFVTPLRTLIVDRGDEDGVVGLDRLTIEEGDQIVFRFTGLNPNHPGPQGAGYLFCEPTIVYEGRRLTYRLITPGNNLPAPLSPNPDEAFVRVVGANAGSWSGASLDAGADWSLLWGEAPRPPLEVELGAPESNIGPADIDDVVARSPMCDATPMAMAQAVEALLGWQREISERTRERAPNPQVGPAPSPFSCYRIRAKDGSLYPTPAAFQDYGGYPVGMLERLAVDLDVQEHEDVAWIAQQSWHHRYSSGFPALAYDSRADEWDAQSWLPGLGCEDVSLNTAVQFALLFELFNDVTYLDLAASILDHAIHNNVLDGTHCTSIPWWHELIDERSWPACGSPSSTTPRPCDPPPILIYALTPTAEALRVYTAVRKYEHETGSMRYSAAYGGLVPWAQACLDSVRAFQRGMDAHFGASTPVTHCSVTLGASCTNPPVATPPAEWWSIDWHSMPVYFNDILGYVGGDADVYRHLEDLLDGLCASSTNVPTDIELQLHCQLRSIVESGVQRLLEPWHESLGRGEFNGGDQVRAWTRFFTLPTETLPGDPTFSSADQMIDAARYYLKHQYPIWRKFGGQSTYIGVTWLNATQDPLQLPVLVGPLPGQPPHYYVQGLLLSMSLALQAGDAETFKDLRAATYTLLRTARLRYKEPAQLDFGFLPRPLGWPGYEPTIENLLAQGADRRMCDRLYESLALTGWEALGAPAKRRAPAVSIQPASFAAPATSPTFMVNVRLPNGSTCGPPETWTLHTRLGWWRQVTAGTTITWEFEELWPSTPTGFNVTANFSSNLIVATVTSTALPSAFDGRPFKFTAVAWDPNGAWAHDTSYQE